MYGPFKQDGKHTAPSNAAFDENLRRQNPEWGVRDSNEIERMADLHDLEMLGRQGMPANNMLLVFAKREAHFAKYPTPASTACERRQVRERRQLQPAAQWADCTIEPCQTEGAWYEAWERRLGCWLDSHQFTEALQRCSHAFSLQLSLRFQSLIGASAAALPADPPEHGCEWVEAIHLPEFPVPGDFRFTSPVLPRLLPWGLQKWNELGGEGPSQPLDTHQTHQGSSVNVSSYAGIAGAGFTLGALLMLGLGSLQRTMRRVNGRQQRQSASTASRWRSDRTQTHVQPGCTSA